MTASPFTAFKTPIGASRISASLLSPRGALGKLVRKDKPAKDFRLDDQRVTCNDDCPVGGLACHDAARLPSVRDLYRHVSGRVCKPVVLYLHRALQQQVEAGSANRAVRVEPSAAEPLGNCKLSAVALGLGNNPLGRIRGHVPSPRSARAPRRRVLRPAAQHAFWGRFGTPRRAVGAGWAADLHGSTATRTAGKHPRSSSRRWQVSPGGRFFRGAIVYSC
jgi:hypothetical protein